MKPKSTICAAITICAFSSIVPLGFGQAITSTFDIDTDGWTLHDDASQPIEWLSSGGNPGGCVRFIEASGGVARFDAPTKFLGDKSAYYSGTLSFDAYRETSGLAGIDPIVLVGGTPTPMTLYFAPTNPPPLGVWETYRIPLLASAGWNLDATNSATEQQLRDVLASLLAMRLPADHIDGNDSSRMDNVVLTAGCPPASIRLSEVEICWPSLSNAVYQVEYRSDLTTNNWLSLFTNIVATSQETCVSDKIVRGTPQRFYRVACPEQ